MATFAYASVLPAPITLEAILAGGIDPASSSTKFILIGSGVTAGYRVELDGSGFSYDVDGLPEEAGTISSVTFFAPGNLQILALSPMISTMSPGEFYQTLLDVDAAKAIRDLVGASTYSGTSGDDRITTFGEDTLIGGTGNDTFFAISGVALIEGGTAAGAMAAGEINRVVVGDSTYGFGAGAVILHNIQEIDLNGNHLTLAPWEGSFGSMKVSGGLDTGLSIQLDDAPVAFLDLTPWDLVNFHGSLGVQGGAGNDVVVVRDLRRVSFNGGDGDDVVDLGRVLLAYADGGDGVDLLRVDLSGVSQSGQIGTSEGTDIFKYGNSFQSLRFDRFDVTSGSGNDRLDGGRYDDTLRGGDGQDDVMGGGANDVLDGGAGADRISGNSGNDSLTGGSGIDLLSGDAGNDTLDGGSGIDMLDGGAGDDVYYVGNRRDVVFEEAGEGRDKVIASVSWTLDEDFEKLVLAGSANLNGTGNDLANVLTGNAGANVLSGQLGKDKLTGGAGRDTFVFDTGLANFDTITDFKHNKDALGLDDAIFAALGVKLNKAEFYAAAGATKAHDANDYIIYNKSTGKLYYDDDGNKPGGHAAVHFATLSNKPVLDHGDFAIV